MKKSGIVALVGVSALVGGAIGAFSRITRFKKTLSCDLIESACEILTEDYDLDNMEGASKQKKELKSFVESIKDINSAIFFNTTDDFCYGDGINDGTVRSSRATARLLKYANDYEKEKYLKTTSELLKPDWLYADMSNSGVNREWVSKKSKEAKEEYLQKCKEAYDRLGLYHDSKAFEIYMEEVQQAIRELMATEDVDDDTAVESEKPEVSSTKAKSELDEVEE